MREIKKRERACFWVIHGERERDGLGKKRAE